MNTGSWPVTSAALRPSNRSEPAGERTPDLMKVHRQHLCR